MKYADPHRLLAPVRLGTGEARVLSRRLRRSSRRSSRRSAKKLTDAEKEYAPDTATAKLEETIEAESLKKSKALDSALEKAVGGPNAGAAAAAPRQPAACPDVGYSAGGRAAPKAGGPASK